MITDMQLAIFTNMQGVALFLLVALYYYVAVNNSRSRSESSIFSIPGFQDIVSPGVAHH